MTSGPTSGWKADWPTWLVVGATGFGGPAGQVAILHREVVQRRQWLDEEEFLAALKLCMQLPGPEAQQLATYAGWRRGERGGEMVWIWIGCHAEYDRLLRRKG